MDPKITVRRRPEAEIEAEIMRMFRNKGWYVKKIHSSTYMPGMPDLFVSHKSLGSRWVEVKCPDRKGDVFTAAQRIEFPLLHNSGVKIYVLVAATDTEYKKVFGEPNWWQFMGIWR